MSGVTSARWLTPRQCGASGRSARFCVMCLRYASVRARGTGGERTMDDARVAETVDYVAIRRLQSAYADVCTRRAWTEFDGLFLPDALVEVDTRVGEPLRFVGPREIGDFI